MAADVPDADGREAGHVLGRVPPVAVPAADISAATAAMTADVTVMSSPTAAMYAEEARQAVIDLVRQHRADGMPVTPADAQRVTGRSVRQARRLLALASADVDQGRAGSPRPRLLEVEG